MSAEKRCPNMNHGRWSVSIRFCPTCGDVVNSALKKVCNGSEHSKRRKNGDRYCIDCGTAIGSSLIDLGRR